MFRMKHIGKLHVAGDHRLELFQNPGTILIRLRDCV